MPAQDPHALAKKLQLIFVQKELRTQLGINAANYARAYSWENITSQVVDLYRALIPNSGR